MDWKAWLARLHTKPIVLDDKRWLMLDVETTGLDPRHDRLLAVAAIGLKVDWRERRLCINLADSFEVDLAQKVGSSKDNILLHGIGVKRQQEGVAPELALRALADFMGNSPLLAFHAGFDQAMVCRSFRHHLGVTLQNPWLDMEQLCAVTHEDVRARSLDGWMKHFNIQCAVRHQAVADALAQCELLLRIWPKLALACSCWRDMQRMAGGQRWLGLANRI